MLKLEMCSDRSTWCSPIGGLDQAGGSTLGRAIRSVLRPGIEIVIDLRRVSFIDADGVAALVECARQARAVGGEVRVCHARPRVRWRLELVGITPFGFRSSAATHRSVA
jgi:anti-anti-sigma factor